ncbi:MAG TPA: hypothetical protein VK137_03985, partial [Planctomycetaceae bacterium]|nr:hypothetical protein [Planctomycetaceae bacterium]
MQPTADDVIRLLGPDGQPWVIPRWATWDEYQKWVKAREANNGPSAPPFSVSSVLFEGSVEANEDSTTLEATVTVSVNHDDGDVLVPLRLNEAILLKPPEHRGPGEHQFDKFDPEAGYRCWLRGKGQHELKLTLAVPVRRQATARRLLLSLPEKMPVSALKLAVPLPKVAAKGPERAVVRTKLLDNGHSEIQAFGLDNLLDLSWQSVTDVSEVKPELQSNTSIAAELRAESFVIEATQLVRSIQGSFDKLTVRLPPEFDLLDVSGDEVKETATVPGSPSRVTVNLMAPTSGPIKLKWVLSAKVAANATRLPVIEGFEVEDARRQIGLIRVTAWEGINLRKREGEDRFLVPGSLNDLRDVPGFLPPSTTNGVTTVYRFLKQPFLLLLDVQKIDPYFSAEPLHIVRLSSGQAEWEMT